MRLLRRFPLITWETVEGSTPIFAATSLWVLPLSFSKYWICAALCMFSQSNLLATRISIHYKVDSVKGKCAKW